MTLDDLERVKRAVLRRYPIFASVALKDIKLELSEEVSTAAVVGHPNSLGVIEIEKIVVNPKFFDNLKFGERVFVLAHEVCHIAFKHFSRALDKPEKDAREKYEEEVWMKFDAFRMGLQGQKIIWTDVTAAQRTYGAWHGGGRRRDRARCR